MVKVLPSIIIKPRVGLTRSFANEANKSDSSLEHGLMEIALHIQSHRDVAAVLRPEDVGRFGSGAKLRPTVELTASLLSEFFAEANLIKIDRVVYGNEFCEHLIPPLEQLEAVIERAAAERIPLTLVTPYVSDSGIAKLRPLLESATRAPSDIEVVFNDWGVLGLLKRDFPRLIPVQGRLMNKSLRDPRIMGAYRNDSGHEATLVTLRRSNLDSASYTNFLAKLGVRRVELDNLPQGVDCGFTSQGLHASAYVPFGFISTSRICMAAGLHYAKPEKFQPGAPCHHECQSHLLEYTYDNSPLGNRDQKFYLKGNTYFYTHSEQMLRTLFQQARAGSIQRLIFQPYLPMKWERTEL